MKKLCYCLLISCIISSSVFAQDKLIYQSKNLSKADTVLVFKPKQYAKRNLYPVIYLLHGYSGNYNQWNRIMNAQKYADEYGFIIVCPDGLFNSWYFNSPVKKDSQFEAFFFDELVPDINKKYKTDTSKIFISGLSMGGHGALYLFLQKPELFLSAGSTSGVMDLKSSGDKYGISDLLGKPGDSDPAWYKYSVNGNIDKLAGTSKQIIFDCGTSDRFYLVNNDLRKKCDSLKINATYISQPGNHDQSYWAKSIRQHFDFFKTLIK
ncbi:MAG: alpha/beta hydrolase family protein [Daejeonella sp.]